MGLFSWFTDNVLGINPPKPPPPTVIKQKQITEVVVIGPTVSQTVAAGPSAEGESIRVLADALVASEALRAQGQVQLVNQLLSSEASRAKGQAQFVNRLLSSEASRSLGQAQLISQISSTSRASIAALGRQATQDTQPAITILQGESSKTEMAIVLGVLVVLAALTFSKRRGR